MTKVFQLYRFTASGGGQAYVDDRGTSHELIARFAVPPDMTAGQAGAIAAQTGGAAINAGQFKNYCPQPGVRGRKLTFIRADGNSMSFVIPTQNTLIAQATGLKTAINAISAGNQVVCIKLDGEIFPNLGDVLGITGARVPGTSSRPIAPATKQEFYSGAFDYESDAVFGSPYQAKMKIATDLVGNPPTEYAGLFTSQTIVLSKPYCPTSEPRMPRHYNVVSLVTQNATQVTQHAQIPVRSNVAANNLNVGQGLAALTATVCIGYVGEKNPRFGLLVP
jgi:hypothetical protein